MWNQYDTGKQGAAGRSDQISGKGAGDGRIVAAFQIKGQWELEPACQRDDKTENQIKRHGQPICKTINGQDKYGQKNNQKSVGQYQQWFTLPLQSITEPGTG